MSSFASRCAATVAALAAVLAMSACSGSSDTQQTEQQSTESPVITGEPAGFNSDDVAFATNMVPHHEQAVEMSALVPQRSTDPEVVTLAEQISAAQLPEINIMNVFLVQWNENPQIGGSTDGGHAGHGQTGMVDDATMSRLESLRGPEFDTLWLESMIGHHQGAVEMAKAEIANGENADAIAMAKTMVATQEAEIGRMKQMLEGKP